MAVALIGPCLEVSKGGYSQGGSQGPHTLPARAAIEKRAAKVTAVVGCADPKEGKGSYTQSPTRTVLHNCTHI